MAGETFAFVVMVRRSELGANARWLGRQVLVLLAGAWRQVTSRKGVILVFAAGLAGAVLLLLPHDAGWLARIRQPGNEAATHWARRFSEWGEIKAATLGYVLALWVWAAIRKERRWVTAGVAVLLAGLVASVVVNVFRPSFGRARPSTDAPPGFYFLETSHDYTSFPSGHATLNVASATAVAIMAPPLALPAAALAGGACWSRLQLNRHYPSDILAGVLLGFLVGWAFGRAGRRLLILRGTPDP